MVRNRAPSFPRQIIVCLSFSLIIALFALSCQKDGGIKQNDPNALTKSEAKAYFEQTAATLKFLTAPCGPAETKNQDYSLTENMVIEWDQALEGETADSYVVEVPIRMVSPVSALLYDGIGHLNKNIRQVQMNVSLVIEKHKDDGCIHHYVSTTVGSYSKSVANTKYGFLCDKSSFYGYQIFNEENGNFVSANHYHDGLYEQRKLFSADSIRRIYGTGKDLLCRGITFIFSQNAITKGGGGATSGESTNCPSCGTAIDVTRVKDGIYICICGERFIVLIDPESNIWNYETCTQCGFPLPICICICQQCGYYKSECICNTGATYCPHCHNPSCDGSCQSGNGGSSGNNGNGNNGESGGLPSGYYQVLVQVHFDAYLEQPHGAVSITPDATSFEAGSTVTISATPFSGYQFVGWRLNGVMITSDNPYSFTVSEHQTYYAVFNNVED